MKVVAKVKKESAFILTSSSDLHALLAPFTQEQYLIQAKDQVYY
jgi:hypothetical protein